MATSTWATNNALAIELTQQATQSEIDGDYLEACVLYRRAKNILLGVVAEGEKRTEQRRRAKLQLRHATERGAAIGDMIEFQRALLPQLPSTLSVEREKQMDVLPLTEIELGELAEFPEYSHSEHSDKFLTPLLDPTIPDNVYHVYVERVERKQTTLVYFNVKDHSKQVAYTLTAIKPTWTRRGHGMPKVPKFQFTSCDLLRSTEYHQPCAHIDIPPITLEPYHSYQQSFARPISITANNKTIVETPDRINKAFWTPSRFDYGGRRFVWKEPGGSWNVVPSLYEVRKEWPKEGSKTGKVDDHTFTRPLVWGETKWARYKTCILHMAGGLDQRFRELCLAMLLGKQLTAWGVDMFNEDSD